MNKPADNKKGLGYKEYDHNATSTSKTTFVPATNQLMHVPNIKPKKKGFVRQWPTRRYRTRQPRDRY